MNRLNKNISINNKIYESSKKHNLALRSEDKENVSSSKKRKREVISEASNKRPRKNALKNTDEVKPITRSAVNNTKFDIHALDRLLDAKKAATQKKRKATLKAKVLNSSIPDSISRFSTEVKYHYRHTQKSKVTEEIAIPFGAGVKKSLIGHISDKNLPFGTHLGLYFTAETPTSPKKGTRLPKRIFEVRKGFDIVLDKTITTKNVVSPAHLDSPYQELGMNAEKIANNMVERGAFEDLPSARECLARDIQRVGGGRNIIGNYTADEWDNLSEFGGVIKIDKARAPKATKYIDRMLLDVSNTFELRFGGDNPLYQGTGKGSVKVGEKSVSRGAEALRALAEESDNGEDTDYGSDKEDL